MTVIRPMRESDVEPLARIIRDVWSMGMYGPDAAMPGSRMYLCERVSGSTFLRTAEVEGEVVGCICAKSTAEPETPEWTERVLSSVTERLRGTRGGMAFLEDLRAYEDACESMTGRVVDLPGEELVLLIVDDGYRGMGIGRRLFECACDHLRSAGAAEVAIITDTDCNVGFYDAAGAELAGKSEMLWSGERLGLFVYRYRLRRLRTRFVFPLHLHIPTMTSPERCPICGSLLEPDYAYCGECHIKIVRMGDTVAPSIDRVLNGPDDQSGGESSIEQPARCRYCGHEMMEGVSFCVNCGRSISVDVPMVIALDDIEVPSDFKGTVITAGKITVRDLEK